MTYLMDSVLHTVLSTVLLSLFAMESADGECKVQFPNVINWWNRKYEPRKPSSGQYISAAYYYPFLCSIIYYSRPKLDAGLKVGEWASAGTILTNHWVIFSIDNLDRPCDNHNSRFNTIRYHFTIYRKELKVVHGTVYGSPATDYQNKYIRKHSIDRLYYRTELEDKTHLFVKDDHDWGDGTWNISQNFARNVLGGAITGVGFARIQGQAFTWDAFTLQAPIVAPNEQDINRKVEEHLKFLEENPGSQQACYVGAYHRYNKKMKWFQVMYIPHDECREVYCTHNSKACLEFPNKDLHLCFKSLVYGDLCPEDRGTAVYCPDFEHSILGILSTAPNCGWKNLPNVYMRIDFVMEMYVYGRTSAEDFFPKEPWRTYRYPDDLKQYTILPPGLVRT